MTAIKQVKQQDGKDAPKIGAQAKVKKEPGERQALELADRLRLLAASDPDLAQDLVEQLIEGLNRATRGGFDEHIEKAGATSVS